MYKIKPRETTEVTGRQRVLTSSPRSGPDALPSGLSRGFLLF